MRNIGFLVLILIIIPVGNAFSEIKSKQVYDNLFNNCMETIDANVPYEIRLNYCTCTTKKAVKQFNYLELLLFERKLDDLNESEKLQIAMGNKKFVEIGTSCFAEVIN